MSYFAATAGTEADYEKALASGCLTVEQFKARCAGYGFTEAKDGSSWDDKCIAHEHAKGIDPCTELAAKIHGVIGPGPAVASRRGLYIAGAVGAAAVLAIVLLR